MAKVDELEVLIKANTSDLKAGLKDTESKLSALGKNASAMGSKLSAGAVAIGGIIAGLVTSAFQALSSEMDGAIERLDTLNNFSKVMSNLGIESGASQQAINKLSDSLQGLPTSLSDAVLAVQRLTAVNSSVEYSTDAFLALNNAILAGGASAQLQSSALEQISQAYAKGKPDMMEWRTMLQAMPAQLKQVAIAMGKTDATALGEGLRDGSISMNDFMNTIMKLNQQGVAGFANFDTQARNATGGVATSITNLHIAIQRGIANIMDAIGQTNISGFINSIASAIGTVSNYVAAFVKILKQAFAWVHALFGGGSGSTAEAVQETGDAMSGVASGAGAVADNLDSASGSAKKLKKTLASFDEMNVLQEQNAGGSGGSGGAGGGGGINLSDYKWDDVAEGANKVDEIVGKIKEKFQQLVEWFKSTPLGQLLEKHLKTWIESAQKWIPKIIEKFKEFGENVWKTLEPLGNLIWSVISGVFDSIVQMWDKYGDQLVEGFWQVIYSIGDLLNSLWVNIIAPVIDPIISSLQKVWDEHLKGVFDKFFNMMGNLWTTIQDIWNNNIYPFIKSLMEFLKPVFDAIGQYIGGLVEWLGGLLGGFFGGIIDAFNGIIDFIGGIFAGDWERVWNGICEFFQGIWDAIWAVLKSIYDWFIGPIVDGVVNAFNEIKRQFELGWNYMTGIFSNIGKWFSDRWNDVKNAFSAVGQWFGNIFSNAWNNITNFFSGIGKWFSDRWNDIKNAFGNVWETFKNIGQNIWNGIVNGLGNIAQKFLDMFRGAIDGIKQFLGIASPSKLFKRFGSFVAEGFAIGIEDETDTVQEALQNMADFTAPDLTPTFASSVSDMMGETLEVEEEKTPVHVTVNVGEETLLNKVIDGINDLSNLTNQNVIHI